MPCSFRYLMKFFNSREVTAVQINLMLIQMFNRNKDQGTGNGIALASLKMGC